MATVNLRNHIIVPGDRRVHLFFTKLTFNEENLITKILSAVASNRNSLKIKRQFPEVWEIVLGKYKKSGFIFFGELQFQLDVIIGAEESLTNSLELTSCNFSRRSMKPRKDILRPTLSFGGNCSNNTIEGIANQLVASWVVKGYGWKNSKGKTIDFPWGD